jgi:cell wall-associated NlpC family hydrolase
MPFSPGARGPDSVDCWGLIVVVYQREFGISLHQLAGASIATKSLRGIERTIEEEAAEEWKEIPDLKEGCVVAMGHGKVMHHVGIFTEQDGGLVLHARPGQNVVADTLKGLRVKGMQVIKFYQYHQWPG